MDTRIAELALRYRSLAAEILREAVRIPADYVDREPEAGGDPLCGLSNHEGPRLEYLKRKIVEIGAVDRPEDVGFDAFGNLVWTVEDPADGIAAAEKRVIWFDGHTDTVQALRPRWHDALGGGLDPYLGLTDPSRVDRSFLASELGYLPPEDEWDHLVWGRGAADQLAGVVCQIIATKMLLETRSEGSLRGVVIRSFGTVAEEDNDGGAPMHVLNHDLRGAGPGEIPDVVILTEGTGDATEGPVGIYRGQRGRMQIEVEVTGKSCHGSMPWEGRNPLEFGAGIIVEAAERYGRGEGFAKDTFLGPGTRTASFATLDTPSDCAVPERFTFRFDRRLTAGEDPWAAVEDVETMVSVARAREAGLTVDVRVPFYDSPTWTGAKPGNPQIYPGWVTPEDHPAIQAAVVAYRGVVGPVLAGADGDARIPREPRVARWVFSTDGVGFSLPATEMPFEVPDAKRWVASGPFRHPAMFGIGAGYEQNTHKVGEYVDSREMALAAAVMARFPAMFVGGKP